MVAESKYDLLAEYLRSQPSDKSKVALSFAEIEDIMRSGLPETARRDRSWWANTLSSNHAYRWILAGWEVAKLGVELDNEHVTFARMKDVGRYTDEARGGYNSVRQFFDTLPSQQIQIALTFAELGAIAGHKLPRTASHDRPWWANTRSSPQGSAWVVAGWYVEKVYFSAKTVVFRRKGPDPLRGIPKYIKSILEDVPRVGHPDLRTICEWIRFCRKVGCYFEGVILFERSSICMDSLADSERAEVEEDYAVCRRELNRYKNHGL